MALVSKILKMATSLPLVTASSTPKGRESVWQKFSVALKFAVDEKRKRNPVLAATLFATRLGKANNGAIYKRDQPLHVAMWPRVTSTTKMRQAIQEIPDPVLTFSLSGELSTLDSCEIERKLRKLHPSITRIVSLTELTPCRRAKSPSDETSHFNKRLPNGIPEEFVMETRTLTRPEPTQNRHNDVFSNTESSAANDDNSSHKHHQQQQQPQQQHQEHQHQKQQAGKSLVMFAMDASRITRRELLHNLRFQLKRDGSILRREFPYIDKDYGVQPVVDFDMDPGRLAEGEDILKKHAKESTPPGGVLTIHNSSALPIKISVSEEDPAAAVHQNPTKLPVPVKHAAADSQHASSSSRPAAELSHTSDIEPGWERAQRFFAGPGDTITLLTATPYALVSILASDEDGQVFEPLRRRLQAGASVEFSERDVNAYRAFSGVLRS